MADKTGTKPIAFVERAPLDKKALVGWFDSVYGKCDDARRRVEPEWWSNILFLEGRQWESAAADVRQYGRVEIKARGVGKTKIVANLIYPLARQAVASLVDNISQMMAAPATSDIEDVDAAQIATDLLEMRHYEDNERQKRLYEVLWCMTCGWALRHTSFDPEADGFTEVGRVQGLGDISSMTVSPFNVHLCPWVDSSEEQPFVILSDVRDVEEINDTYHSEVQPEEYADYRRITEGLALSLVQSTDSAGSGRQNAAILKRMYCAPSKGFPRGRLLVVANGELLDDTELPEREMGFRMMEWFPIPRRTYPMAMFTPMRDIQRDYNITLSQLIELKNRQLRGDMVIRGPMAARVTEEYAQELLGTDEKGQPRYRETDQKIVRIDPSITEWKFLEYNLNSADARGLLDIYWQNLLQVSGIHESALGQLPPTGTPATTALLLKDSDLTGLTLFRAGFDWAYSKVARMKLVVAKNHYDIPRVVRTVGRNFAAKTRAFFGADLRDTEDVRPRPTPIVSETVKAQLRRENAPLYDLSGPAQVKLAKVTALLSSGIPGIGEEVEQLLSPYSIEDLRSVCAAINKIEVQISIVQAEAALNAAVMGVAGQEAAAQAATQGAAGGGAAEGEPGGSSMGPPGPTESQAGPQPGQGATGFLGQAVARLGAMKEAAGQPVH